MNLLMLLCLSSNTIPVEGNAHQSLAIKILNEMLLDDCKSEWVKPLSKVLPLLNLKRNVSDRTIDDIRRLSKKVIMISHDSDTENREQSESENGEEVEQREYDDLANQISEATSSNNSTSSLAVVADRRLTSRGRNGTPPVKMQPKLLEKQLTRRLIKLDLNIGVDSPASPRKKRQNEKDILKQKNAVNETNASREMPQRSPSKRSLRSSSSSSTQSSTKMSLRSSKGSSRGTPQVKRPKNEPS
uniref:Uncharacterized protein n=1 Tax=Romanomermis culicivorax TaxID=13658 RepID=A0A915JFX9_ROMCU